MDRVLEAHARSEHVECQHPVQSRGVALYPPLLKSTKCKEVLRAGNGTRTRDFNLGKLSFYYGITRKSLK